MTLLLSKDLGLGAEHFFGLPLGQAKEGVCWQGILSWVHIGQEDTNLWTFWSMCDHQYLPFKLGEFCECWDVLWLGRCEPKWLSCLWGEVAQMFFPLGTVWQSPYQCPSDSTYEGALGENALLWGLTRWGQIQMGKGVSIGDLGSWVVEGGEVKPCKEQCPASLTGAQSLGRFEVFNAFVGNVNHKRIMGPIQPVMPFLQSQFDCQELLVFTVIVSVNRGQFLWKESHRK